MFTSSAITEALASEHRRDLITQAHTYRLARAARRSGTIRPSLFPTRRRPVNLAKATKRTVTAAIAAIAAASVLMASPAGATRPGAQHISAVHFKPQASFVHF